MRYLLAAILVSTSLASLAWCDDASSHQWSIKPLGLRIVGPLPEEKGFPRPFNWGTGTTTVLMCSPPTGFVLGFDRQQSSVNGFADERGNDLAVEPRSGFSQRIRFSVGGYSADRRHAMIEIFGAGVPYANANSFKTVGELVFILARKKEIHVYKNLPLKTGQEIVVGDHSIALKEVRPLASGRTGLDVVVFANGKIGDMRFFDVEDNPISARKVAFNSVNSEKLVSKIETTWRLPEEIDVATVEVDEWKDVEKVMVRFDVRVSVGLGTAEE